MAWWKCDSADCSQVWRVVLFVFVLVSVYAQEVNFRNMECDRRRKFEREVRNRRCLRKTQDTCFVAVTRIVLLQWHAMLQRHSWCKMPRMLVCCVYAGQRTSRSTSTSDTICYFECIEPIFSLLQPPHVRYTHVQMCVLHTRRLHACKHYTEI